MASKFLSNVSDPDRDVFNSYLISKHKEKSLASLAQWTKLIIGKSKA